MDLFPKNKPRNFFSLVLAAGFCRVVFLCALVDMAGMMLSPCSAEEIPRAVVEFDAVERTTTYRIVSGDCTIEWIVRDSEKHVVKHRAQCAAPLKRQLPLLLKLATEFFSNERHAQTLRTLFWGGLESESKPASGELSLRLALAACQSPGWDLRKGKAREKDLNRFVIDLANEKMIYSELQELFEAFGRRITLRTVEKVRVLEAGQLPFFEQLRQQGMRENDRLPFDCMAWFSISRK